MHNMSTYVEKIGKEQPDIQHSAGVMCLYHRQTFQKRNVAAVALKDRSPKRLV